MCLRRVPEKYIAGAALDRAALELSCVRLCEDTKYERIMSEVYVTLFILKK
jgi:hypothetical protein